MRRLQNKVSESRLTLTVMAAFGVAVWLAYGLVGDGLWVQFACFAATTWLMSELNNTFALIRIFSRMVASVFIALSCAACFLFSSMSGAVVALCLVACYAMLFRCYQDNRSTGYSFYAFAFIGLASLFQVHVLFFVPIYWLLMAACILCLSWRTLLASLFGLCCPYWFWAAYLAWTGDWHELVAHFAGLASFGPVAALGTLPLGHLLALALTFVVGVIGATHYYRQSHDDKIRTRMFYNCFVAMWAASALLVALQPQHSDLALRIMAINASPLIAHFASLTNTRLTNITFVVIAMATLLLTAYNVYLGIAI